MSPLEKFLALIGVERKKQVKKVPILGIEGSGKSSLIVTLGQYVSVRALGNVTEESLAAFNVLLPYVMRGEPMAATMRYDPVALQLRRLPESATTWRDVDLLLTSEDIPGQDFRLLARELESNPNLERSTSELGAILDRLGKLLTACDGLIFVVDIARHAADGERALWKAISEQIAPIMTAIRLATKRNGSIAGKPIIFVFTKPDLHGLTPERVDQIFRRSLAVPLGLLVGLGVPVHRVDVRCAGWSIDDPDLQGLGIDVLLSNLGHALGAVSPQGSS